MIGAGRRGGRTMSWLLKRSEGILRYLGHTREIAGRPLAWVETGMAALRMATIGIDWFEHYYSVTSTALVR
jgi:hypothetical protein